MQRFTSKAVAPATCISFCMHMPRPGLHASTRLNKGVYCNTVKVLVVGPRTLLGDHICKCTPGDTAWHDIQSRDTEHMGLRSKHQGCTCNIAPARTWQELAATNKPLSASTAGTLLNQSPSCPCEWLTVRYMMEYTPQHSLQGLLSCTGLVSCIGT